MIKIGDRRYNPDKIKKYYPGVFHSAYSIVIEWDQGGQEDITFDSKEERDKTIEAMDEAFLMIDNGKVLKSTMEVDMLPPFDFGGGGPGGINLQ
jgi:hypothetical protein